MPIQLSGNFQHPTPSGDLQRQIKARRHQVAIGKKTPEYILYARVRETTPIRNQHSCLSTPPTSPKMDGNLSSNRSFRGNYIQWRISLHRFAAIENTMTTVIEALTTARNLQQSIGNSKTVDALKQIDTLFQDIRNVRELNITKAAAVAAQAIATAAATVAKEALINRQQELAPKQLAGTRLIKAAEQAVIATEQAALDLMRNISD